MAIPQYLYKHKAPEFPRNIPKFKGEGESSQPIMRVIANAYLRAPRLSYLRNFLSQDEFKKIAHLSADPVQFHNADGDQLKGYLYLVGNKSERTVILGHGYCAHSGSMLPLVQPLHKMGYNVFLFDFRAHGESGGAKTSLGFHEGKDIAAAINFLNKEYGHESKKVYYLGHSMGAAACLYMPKNLEKHPDLADAVKNTLKKIILDSSYEAITPSEDPNVSMFLRFLPGFLKKPILKIVADFEERSQDMLELPKPLNKLFPAELYSEHPDFLQKPILLLHGRNDTRTPFSHSENIFEKLSSKGIPVKLVGLDADHFVTTWRPHPGFGPYNAVLRDDERYLQSVSDFLKEPDETAGL